MKYGLLNNTGRMINAGETLMHAGIKEVYKRLGIPKEDIIAVERDRLYDYEGEYLLLPMNSYFDSYDRGEKKRMKNFLSERIIPIFIGIHAVTERQVEKFARYSHHGPFGCRDVETMKAFRRAGMEAYVSGCLSICQPRMERTRGTTTFLIDVPEELYPFIPEEILQNSEELLSPCREFEVGGGQSRQYRSQRRLAP